MFEIGWSELLVIAVVAIIVVGPKDLPRMLRTFGGFLGKARRMAFDVQRQFNDVLREAERQADLDDVRKQLAEVKSFDPLKDVKDSINDVKSSLQDSVSLPKGPLVEPAATPSGPAAEAAPTVTPAASEAVTAPAPSPRAAPAPVLPAAETVVPTAPPMQPAVPPAAAEEPRP